VGSKSGRVEACCRVGCSSRVASASLSACKAECRTWGL
jgi:hypothetical protein